MENQDVKMFYFWNVNENQIVLIYPTYVKKN